MRCSEHDIEFWNPQKKPEISCPAEGICSVPLQHKGLVGTFHVNLPHVTEIGTEVTVCGQVGGSHRSVRGVSQHRPPHPYHTRPTSHLPPTSTSTGPTPYCKSGIRRHVAGWHSSQLWESLVLRTSYSAQDGRRLVDDRWSKDEVALRLTVGQSVSMSWYRTPLWDLRPDSTSCRNVAVWNLRSCFCGAPSLTKGRVSNLQCNHSMVRVAQNP
jgi:hypothetical protein